MNVVFLLLLTVLVGCEKREPNYIPGIYINETEGYYSQLRVSVTLDQYHIIDIEVLSHEEPKILAEIVFEKLPPKIIKKNGIDVDIISGATYTSRALIEAVEKAIEQAKVVEE